MVGFHGIEPFDLLELVGLELGQHSDASTFLTHVKNNALASRPHLDHRLVKLGAAIAQAAAKDVARQALAMDADKDRLFLLGNSAANFHADPAYTQCKMRLQIDKRCVRDQVEITQAR